MFESIIATTGITLESCLICSAASIILGLIIAFVYMKTGKYSKNFVLSLALLPFLVQIVIMMVNGNLGTSVAVLGAFSLVRFRSLPGNSKEIIAVFFSMAVGIATGMGCIAYAAIFVLIAGLMLLVLSNTGFGESHTGIRELKIQIPENLDFENIFDDLFDKYLKTSRLEEVKTTNMGSLYELIYTVELKQAGTEKALIDDIRTRNGNLHVTYRRKQEGVNEL